MWPSNFGTDFRTGWLQTQKFGTDFGTGWLQTQKFGTDFGTGWLPAILSGLSESLKNATKMRPSLAFLHRM